MNVFVTGATGFIGSAVVKELIAAGHQVTGLARSEAAAQKLLSFGVTPHPGDLTDLDSLKAGVTAADGVIHLGFIHDFTRFADVCAIDKTVIETMGQALLGTDKPFVVTSGTAVINGNELLTEDMRLQGTTHNPRSATELAVDVVAAQGIRVSVVRLSPSVHGEGDAYGFVPILINLARQHGKVAVINGGSNVWPGVHRLDAARLYRLALEKEAPSGTRYHAVADQGVSTRQIAEAIAAKLNLPVVSLTFEEAPSYFGWFQHFASFNNPSSSAITQAMLDWHPTHPSLMDDLRGDVYFPAQ
ncbi:SDR family oxidoreductase [Spirosoma aerolatum]|uniref:SDR family oxidoreductase n=1 Tax=Spirosoma aerolatum TaxID=1211326 RepID=UPI0009AE53E1|nr:SDR family oxidoreductase [Spirosoma aerolatum]